MTTICPAADGPALDPRKENIPRPPWGSLRRLLTDAAVTELGLLQLGVAQPPDDGSRRLTGAEPAVSTYKTFRHSKYSHKIYSYNHSMPSHMYRAIAVHYIPGKVTRAALYYRNKIDLIEIFAKF